MIRRDSRGRFTTGGRGTARKQGERQKTVIDKGERARRTYERRRATEELSGRRLGGRRQLRPVRGRTGRRVITRVETRYRGRLARRRRRG